MVPTAAALAATAVHVPHRRLRAVRGHVCARAAPAAGVELPPPPPQTQTPGFGHGRQGRAAGARSGRWFRWRLCVVQCAGASDPQKLHSSGSQLHNTATRARARLHHGPLSHEPAMTASPMWRRASAHARYTGWLPRAPVSLWRTASCVTSMSRRNEHGSSIPWQPSAIHPWSRRA